VLFVGGMGRSGSTLMGRLLAEVPGFVTVGELGFIWHRGFAQNVRCGCGVPFRDCPFWQHVLGEAFGSGRGPTEGVLQELRTFWDQRALPLVAFPALWPQTYRRRFELYRDHVAALLGAVQRVTGARAIVDTSKTPAHLVALASVPGLAVHVVHLVRDSRAVAYSWEQRRQRGERDRTDVDWPPSSPWKTAALWDGVNALMWAVRRRATSYTTVRYEDFVSAPAEHVRRLVAVVDGSAAPEPEAPRGAEGVARLGVHHTVAGNPMRFQTGPIEVREDNEWREAIGTAGRAVVTALTWPLLRMYGYR